MTVRTGSAALIAAPRRRARALGMAGLLHAAAGALLGAALVFAPWCWGCAWPAGIRLLDLMLLSATALWLGSALLRRERRPAILFTAIALILIQGWTMTLNARSVFAEAAGMFGPLEQPLPGWPGSVERDLSLDMMARVTALLGAALIAASLGRERAWRRRFCAVIVLTAVSIVLLGCAEHWSGATDLFWSRGRRLDYFFASYRNVTNAGEYLNLAVPLAMAAAWIARDRSPWFKAAAVCALAMLVAGSCVCGSKAAPILTVILGTGFLIAKRAEFGRGWARSGRSVLVVATLAAALALMVWGAGLGVAEDRWNRFLVPAGEVTMADRVSVDRVCLGAAREAGALGAGPGTFPVVFERLQIRSSRAPAGRWLVAHDDYLQTDLEWGALGAATWAIFFFGSLLSLGRGLTSAPWRREDRTWALGISLALAGAAVMALVDFPFQVASIQLQVAVLAGLGWSSFAWPRARFRRP